MKQLNSLALLSTLAVFAAAPTFGQDHKKVMPDGAGHQAKAELESPTLIQANLGAQALINDDAGYNLGSMMDHVIDRETGKILFVAVQLKEEVGPPRLVPFDRFSWDSETKALMLPLSREFLLTLPVFEPELLKRTGDLDKKASDMAADKASDRAGQAKEAAMAKRQPRHLAATSLINAKVLAMSESFGTVSSIVINPNHGTVEFALVQEAAATDPIVLPWKAMSWETNEEMKGHFALPLAPDQLTDAPRLPGGDLARINDKELIHSIRAFFKHLSPQGRMKPVEDTRG